MEIKDRSEGRLFPSRLSCRRLDAGRNFRPNSPHQFAESQNLPESNIDPVIDDRMSYEKLAKIRPIRLAKKNAKNSNIPAKAQSATEPLIAEIEPSLTEASSETKKSESDSHQT